MMLNLSWSFPHALLPALIKPQVPPDPLHPLKNGHNRKYSVLRAAFAKEGSAGWCLS